VLPFELFESHCLELKRQSRFGRSSTLTVAIFSPKQLTVVKDGVDGDIYRVWWKFSTPVRDGDVVTLYGDLIMADKQSVVLLAELCRHWLKIYE
jgi:hypothetical protein